MILYIITSDHFHLIWGMPLLLQFQVYFFAEKFHVYYNMARSHIFSWSFYNCFYNVTYYLQFKSFSSTASLLSFIFSISAYQYCSSHPRDTLFRFISSSAGRCNMASMWERPSLHFISFWAYQPSWLLMMCSTSEIHDQRDTWFLVNIRIVNSVMECPEIALKPHGPWRISA